MGIRRSRWALVMAFALALAGPVMAQDAAEDEELRKLREEAAEEAETAPAKPGAAVAPGAPAPGAPGMPSAGAGGGLMQQLNAFNPRITVFGDFLGRAGVGKKELPEDDRMSVREIELDLRADVDPYAKAVFILAVEEEEPGEYVADPEEIYATFEALPWNLRAQAGRWFQRFGQANRTHRHDFMWVEAPLAYRDFLGEEGLKGDGAALMWLAPGFPLELEGAILNGENRTVLAGGESDSPAWLGRANLFIDLAGLSPRSFLNLGASYLFGFNDRQERNETHLVGGDAMLTFKPTQFFSVTALAEVYYLTRETGPGARSPLEHALGWYGALQVQPLQQLYLGARYDFSDYAEQIEDNDQWAASAYVSWYTTEFMRIRLGYEHRERRSTGFPGARQDQPDLDTLFLQVTFVFGSHPVEPFWVNR